MGLIVGFDWSSWSESGRYCDGEPVENEVVAVRFLTAVVRAERFSEGTLARAVDTRVFAGALRVLCDWRGDDRSHALVAVNHGGDSDSTGAITVNILGTLLGEEAIAAGWLTELEGRKTIARMANLLTNEPDD